MELLNKLAKVFGWAFVIIFGPIAVVWTIVVGAVCFVILLALLLFVGGVSDLRNIGV